jgi:TatD DNase family protein
VLTDTHCHLDSEAFDADRETVIERALHAGVARMLIPGLHLESSARAVQLAEAHPVLFAAVGIHPSEAERWNTSSLNALRALARHPKVRAIGEIGLDYFWVHDPALQARQRQVLQAQLSLAAELDMPVVIHCREQSDAEDGPCARDLLSLFEQWLHVEGGQVRTSLSPGVLHSFSGSLATALRAIELGFYIGVTGPVTYKNATSRRDTLSALPLDRLLIETDAPYLAPHPFRGKRNEPAYVTHIADKIADIQSRTPQEVAAVTGDNAVRLFSWGETA